MKAVWNEIRYWLKGQTFWEYLVAFIPFYKTIYLCFAHQAARNLISVDNQNHWLSFSPYTHQNLTPSITVEIPMSFINISIVEQN